MKLTVGEVVKSGFFKHGDKDICDNFDERSWIAYCGTSVTDEGEKEFKIALDRPCWFNVSNKTLIIDCNDEIEADTTKRMFCAMAGFCTSEEYDKWFMEG